MSLLCTCLQSLRKDRKKGLKGVTAKANPYSPVSDLEAFQTHNWEVRMLVLLFFGDLPIQTQGLHWHVLGGSNDLLSKLKCDVTALMQLKVIYIEISGITTLQPLCFATEIYQRAQQESPSHTGA